MATKLESIAHRPRLLAEAKRLSAINNLRNARVLAIEWSLIGASVIVSSQISHWTVYLFACLIIGARQHALGILMHDAAHHRLFSNRQLNEWVSDFVCALPLGIITERYRHDHFRHHNRTNTEQDPYWLVMNSNPADWEWPKSKVSASFVFLGDMIGLGAVAFNKEWAAWFPWSNHFSTRAYPPRLTMGGRLRVLSLLWSYWTNCCLFWVLVGGFDLLVHTIGDILAVIFSKSARLQNIRAFRTILEGTPPEM